MNIKRHPIYNNYGVTKDGRIYSFKSKIYLKPSSGGANSPYLHVRIANKSMKIHRLVAETYLSNPLNKRCVHHIDSNKFNNRVSNLQWVTHKENIGCIDPSKRNHGIKCAYNTNVDKRVKVSQLNKNGRLIKTFLSVTEASIKTGIDRSSISNAMHKRFRFAGGYSWVKHLSLTKSKN